MRSFQSSYQPALQREASSPDAPRCGVIAMLCCNQKAHELLLPATPTKAIVPTERIIVHPSCMDVWRMPCKRGYVNNGPVTIQYCQYCIASQYCQCCTVGALPSGRSVVYFSRVYDTGKTRPWKISRLPHNLKFKTRRC